MSLQFPPFNTFFKYDLTTKRYPTKLPLSTVDTYLGIKGSFVLICYQLYKCPFHLGYLSIVKIISFNYSKAFFPSIYPKSFAEITASNDKPILVEDVLNTIFSFLPS